MGLNFPASPTVGELYPVPPLTDVPQYEWDGTVWVARPVPQETYVKKTGDVMSGDLTVGKTNPSYILNKAASGQFNQVIGQTASAVRWSLVLGNSTAEGGSNTGSDFQLIAYSDAASATLPVIISRATGLMTVLGNPTAALGVATKQYVDGIGFTTGDIKMTFKTAEAGWLVFNDQAFGGTNSGASSASAANQDLFTMLFNNCSDTWAPLQNNAGTNVTRASQGAATSAWANGCRIVLPKVLGRALAAAGNGAGLAGRSLGQSDGVESFAQTTTTMPSHAHQSSTGGTFFTGSAGLNNYDAIGGGSIQGAGNMTASAGGNTAHTLVQPVVYFNVLVKL